jgi:hypothetical protein
MTVDNGFFRYGFQHGRAYEQSDRERIAELNAPPARNDPTLFEKVRARVLRPFYIGGGKVAQEGDTLELERHDAESMAAIKRVKLL